MQIMESKKPFMVGPLYLAISFLLILQAGCSSTPAVRKEMTEPPGMAETMKVDGIERFARIDTDVYRGGSPTDSGLKSLKRAGVRTLVCLRDDVPYRETAGVLGLRIEHIPLSALDTPSRESILRFLDIVTDPALRPVFFHCRQGEDRTGVMAAIYRMQVQGWPPEAAAAEMKAFGFGGQFLDLKKSVLSYSEDRGRKTKARMATDVETALEAGNRLLAAGMDEKAIPRFQAVLQKGPDLVDARLGLSEALGNTGKTGEALSEVRQAMIRSGSGEERIRTSRVTIRILDAASHRGELPPYGLDLAEREWEVLNRYGAEDRESLLRLGDLFQRGLYLSRAIEALERARRIAHPSGKVDLDHRVEHIRSVYSFAPRSDLGKRLGLLPQVTRGELAALLVHELLVDRIRTIRGSATWRPYVEKQAAAPAVKDIEDSAYRDDIRRVLALGIRGLEPFPDGTFRPSDAVSRAEFAVILEDVLSRATRDETLATQMMDKASRFEDVEASAWYKSAADLALSLGLFAPGPGAPPRFQPIKPITGVESLQAFRLLRKRLDSRSRAIVIVVDALRGESAYNALDAKRLPNLERLIRERGVVRFAKCLSALPSITLPNHTTIFTGVYPGRHGVPGNEWFDRTLDANVPLYRRTREYVKYGSEDDPGLGRAWSFGGIPVHDQDLSRDVRTIYEAFKEAETARGRTTRSAVVFDPVRRGGDVVVNPDLFDALISLDVLPFVNQYALLDTSATRKAVALIRSENPPELMGLWLSGLDGLSHAKGPGPIGGAGDRQADYLAEHLDPLIGEIVKALEDRGLLDETLIFLASDHGQADAVAKDEITVDAERVYRALAGSPYRPPLDKSGRLDENATDFDIAVMADSNGNAALVSIRPPGAPWSTPPARSDIEAVSALLLKEPYVSRIFFSETGIPGKEPAVFLMSENNGKIVTKRLERESEERLNTRALGLSGSGRSGDLLVEAKSPYYFSPRGSIYLGQHGRGERVEDQVPLLIMNPSGGRQSIVRSVVEIDDIAPTVAGALGFLDALPADGTDLLDPPKILVSSHAEDQVVPAGGTTSILGFVKDSVGIERVEFRVDGEDKFHAAEGTTFWEARVRLTPGRHAVVVRAIDETGIASTVRFHLIAQ